MKETEIEMLLGFDIESKIRKSKEILKEALDEFTPEGMAVAMTGGKDSTTTLWILKQLCAEWDIPLPICVFIDEGDIFDEILEFVNDLKEKWSLNIAYLKNEDVSSKAKHIGDRIRVSELNDQNRAELEKIGTREEEFEFIPDSYICNHLMKTVPLKNFISENNITALITAIRWDEQEARKGEEYFSPRQDPDHTRVHPILHFTERDIWIAIHKYEVPFNKLYRFGYRSLGAKCATGKASDIPAWMQDLEHTPERVGRGQEKEKVMDQLRALGYM